MAKRQTAMSQEAAQIPSEDMTRLPEPKIFEANLDLVDLQNRVQKLAENLWLANQRIDALEARFGVKTNF